MKKLEIDEDNFSKDYVGGFSLRMLAEKYKCSKSFAHSKLRKMGVKLRRPGVTKIYDVDLSEIEDLLVGTILGDSTIVTTSCTFSLSIEHCLEQEEYLKYKVSCLKGLEGKFYYRSRLDKRTGKVYKSVTFKSKRNPIFNKLYELLYPNGIKDLTDYALTKLTPRALSFLYFDDGNLYKTKDACHLTLSINSFSELGKSSLISYFKNKYSINFKIHQKAIRVTSKKQVLMFLNIIRKYRINCMEYKFGGL